VKNMNKEYKKMKEIDEGTDALIQVRQDAGGNYIHLQVYGKEGNREYGYADKFTAPPVVAESLRNTTAKLYQSLATDSPIYFRDMVTVHGYTDGVQLHILSQEAEVNGQECFILDLPAQRFGDFIAYIESVGLLINHEGEQRFVASLQEEE